MAFRRRALLIAIDSKAEVAPPPEPPPANASRPRRFFVNQHVRRSWMLRFISGVGLWRISREYGVPPIVIEQELRERLIRSGALNQDRAA